MSSSPLSPFPSQRWLPLLVTVAAHLGLLWFWLGARPAPDSAPEQGLRIQWLRLTPPPRSAPPLVPRAPPVLAAAPRPRSTRPTPASTPTPAALPPSSRAAMVLPAPDPFEDSQPAPSAADQIRKQALRDIGKIDQDLRKQSLNKFAKNDSSPQQRLAAGIAAAAVNKWNEPAQIEEVYDNTGSGKKIYKIKTAHGSYCMSTKPNHSLDGFDSAKNKIMLTTCPGNF